MADKTIRENFFDAKAIGSLWDVAVSLKRGNPLPIDADSVFESEAKLIEYIGDKITTVAYPGQVVAVVNETSTQIFYIDQELNYHPVGTKLDADGKSIKVDNNVLKLVGFDEAADGLLAQVKVDAEGNRTLNWVSIETIAQGDGNTTYTFTGKYFPSDVYFEVKASDVDTATKIYLDTYSKYEIDDKFKDVTYDFYGTNLLPTKYEELDDYETTYFQGYYPITFTKDGVDFKVDIDGTVTVNGDLTNSASGWVTFTICSKINLPSGMYRLSGCPSGGDFYGGYSLAWNGTMAYDEGSGVIKETEGENEDNQNDIKIYLHRGNEYNNLKFKPRLVRIDDYHGNGLETNYSPTSNYFEIVNSETKNSQKVYIDAYDKSTIDSKIANINKNINSLDKEITDAGYQNASDVSTAITNALTDYYNKEAIDGKVEDLEGKISAIPKFAIEVVSELPTENISDTTVYLVPDNDTKTSDVYDEYIHVNGNWELLGKQTLDLTDYATKTFVTDEIAKLSAEGGAIKEVADAHNELALDVDELAETIGDENNGLVKDIADLKAIDHEKIAEDAANAAITAHNADKSHLTADDVDGQIDAKLTVADYVGKIATAKDEAIAAALIKTVDEDQFTVTDGKLTLDAIAQDKITGLSEVFADIYTKEEVDTKIGNKPTKTIDEETGKNVYSGATGLYVDIYTKDEVTDLISSFTGGESAADVLAELNKYKSSNDDRVKTIEDTIGKEAEGEVAATGIIGDIAAINTKLDTIAEGAQVNVLEGVKVNGVALAITDKIVDIPAATADKFGVVKLGSEFKTAEDGSLEVKELNINKLVQTEGEYLILNGGLASDIK